MNSIRLRLFAVLVLATGIVWLSAVAWIQQSTRAKVERVLDARLSEAAQMVSSLISDQRIDVAHAAEAIAAAPPPAITAAADAEGAEGYSHRLSCQIWSLDGALVGSSGSAPASRLAEPTQAAGFSTNSVDGESWRVYSVVNEELGVRVMVGDSYQVRDRLVSDVTKGLVFPALLMLPILAALIWISLRRGLMPLDRMAAGLSRRPADDLSPVAIAPLPREVRPMGDALNGLFARVDAMRDREKAFTSFAAHELKTPLAGIKTQAQVAAMAPDGETRAQALARIEQGVARADRMVRQLLALAALDSREGGAEAAQDGVAKEPTGEAEAGEIARTVAADLARRAAAGEVEITIDDRTAGSALRAEPLLLAVALRNLAENAVLASPRGGTVRIVIETGPGGGCVSVLDRGPGIDAADRARVTDRFFRGRGAPEGGSGLGLSIVQSAASRLGGRLEFAPRPGGGEAARLRLPIPPGPGTTTGTA